MATTTKLVRGTFRDGDNSATAGAATVVKKINDITTAATNIYAVDITRVGNRLVAVIVYN